MDGNTVAIIASLPWVVSPLVTSIRMLHSVSLDQEDADPPPHSPHVSVVIPARNEARNIERCVASVLSNDYPNFDVVVVDDQSDDETGAIVRGISDPRLTVVETGAPPPEWFGKQWACQTGANASQGEIILFADADTTHSPDLVTRSVNGMLRRNADLFSVMGWQELGSFWERVVQPQVFLILFTRYGGSEHITRSKSVKDKIANGQCLFVRRAAYDELGGHSLVKSHVADDLMMAQRYFASGRTVVVENGLEQLSTRMYTSLSELIHGWGKNVFAGGRDAVPMGLLGQIFFPVMLLSAPLFMLTPSLVLIFAFLFSLPAPLLLFGSITQIGLWIWWAAVYLRFRESPLYALLFPLGAAVVLYIFVRAMLRGQRVTWKGRTYLSR